MELVLFFIISRKLSVRKVITLNQKLFLVLVLTLTHVKLEVVFLFVRIILGQSILYLEQVLKILISDTFSPFLSDLLLNFVFLLLFEPFVLQSLHLSLFVIQKLLELLKILHEYLSPFQSSFLDHNFRLWEELEQIFQNVLLDTQERGPVLLGCLLHIVLFASDLHNESRPKIIHKLVLAEERVLWQLDERSNSFLVIEDGRPFRDEIHLCELLAMRHDCLSWLINSAIHAHNQLMLKAHICI
jgi:hypothetical protein